MKAINIKNINFSYGEKTVLKDLSLSIDQGKFVSVLGHNGCGKSTLSKIIMGLLEVDSGEIEINGMQLNLENIDQIRNEIGIVFQNPDNQFIGCTMRDDIAFGLENQCVPSDEMDNIIQKVSREVGMENFLNHEPEKLSGGQKQRVAIAGILAMNLKIIILDEATSMLDPKGKELINNLIHKLKKQKKLTIINITHDVEEAMQSDEVIVLDDGHIVMQDTPDNVFNNSTLLSDCNLDKPFVLKVKSMLTQAGVFLDCDNSIEGVVNELCQLKSKI